MKKARGRLHIPNFCCIFAPNLENPDPTCFVLALPVLPIPA